MKIKTMKRLLIASAFALSSGCTARDTIDAARSSMVEQRPVALSASVELTEAVGGFFDKRKGRAISVMGFEDLTGQRIESGTSAAVASSGRILTEYLLDQTNTKDRFQVLDRNLLTEMVNERRLAAQANATNEAEVLANASEVMRPLIEGTIAPVFDVPDLTPVDYMLQGAVVGFDRRLLDGGNGAGLLGMRVNERISRDQITVMIKLVDVATGKIIGTGHSTRFIDSSMASVGVFKFLREDKLLEIESGIAINDAASLALFYAIDGALQEVFGNA